MSFTDPTTAARAWLAANPDHEAATHVKSALDSAVRYEAIAREAAEAPPGGTRIVIMTIEDGGRIVITAPDRASEVRIAEILGGYMDAVLSMAKDDALATLRARLAKRVAALAGRTARKKPDTAEGGRARGALDEANRIAGWVERAIARSSPNPVRED